MHRAAPTHALQLGTAQAEPSTPAEGGKEVTTGQLHTPNYRACPHLVTETPERSKHWSRCLWTGSWEADGHGMMFMPNWSMTTRVEKQVREGSETHSRVCLMEAERPGMRRSPPPEETKKGLKET